MNIKGMQKHEFCAFLFFRIRQACAGFVYKWLDNLILIALGRRQKINA